MAVDERKAERKKATRPYLVRALIGLAVAIAGAVVANLWAIEKGGKFTSTDQIGLIGVLVFVIGGVILVRSAVSAFNIAASDSLQERAKGTPVSFLVYAAGYLFVALGAI